MQLIDEFPSLGRVLDLGSGTGDLAIALAQRGTPVLGVEFAEAAVDVARSRLLDLPAEQRALAEFEIGDALHPSRWEGEIGSVVDSGFFHLFDAATRRSFVLELARSLPPGGRYYMLGFAVSLPAPDVPREVRKEEIHELFSESAGWTIQALSNAQFHTSGFDHIPALALCAERIDGAGR